MIEVYISINMIYKLYSDNIRRRNYLIFCN